MKLYNFGIDYYYVIELLKGYKDFVNKYIYKEKKLSWDKLGKEMGISIESLKSWLNKTRKPSLGNILTIIDYLKKTNILDFPKVTIDDCLYERKEIIEEIDKYEKDLFDEKLSEEKDKKEYLTLRNILWEDIMYLIQKKLFFILKPKEERSLSNYLIYYCCYSDKALKKFDIHNRRINYNSLIKYLQGLLPYELPMKINDDIKIRVLNEFEDLVILTTGDRNKYQYKDVYGEEE